MREYHLLYLGEAKDVHSIQISTEADTGTNLDVCVNLSFERKYVKVGIKCEL
jgi:hypothetical protein